MAPHNPFDVGGAGQILASRRDTVARIAVTRAMSSGVLIQSDPIAAFAVVSVLRSAIQVVGHVF